MRLVGEHEVLESVFVEMDPVLDGFCGVLVELLGVGEGYVLLETAAADLLANPAKHGCRDAGAK